MTDVELVASNFSAVELVEEMEPHEGVECKGEDNQLVCWIIWFKSKVLWFSF
jgi:hypothetical protein